MPRAQGHPCTCTHMHAYTHPPGSRHTPLPHTLPCRHTHSHGQPSPSPVTGTHHVQWVTLTRPHTQVGPGGTHPSLSPIHTPQVPAPFNEVDTHTHTVTLTHPLRSPSDKSPSTPPPLWATSALIKSTLGGIKCTPSPSRENRLDALKVAAVWAHPRAKATFNPDPRHTQPWPRARRPPARGQTLPAPLIGGEADSQSH